MENKRELLDNFEGVGKLMMHELMSQINYLADLTSGHNTNDPIETCLVDSLSEIRLRTRQMDVAFKDINTCLLAMKKLKSETAVDDNNIYLSEKFDNANGGSDFKVQNIGMRIQNKGPRHDDTHLENVEILEESDFINVASENMSCLYKENDVAHKVSDHSVLKGFDATGLVTLEYFLSKSKLIDSQSHLQILDSFLRLKKLQDILEVSSFSTDKDIVNRLNHVRSNRNDEFSYESSEEHEDSTTHENRKYGFFKRNKISKKVTGIKKTYMTNDYGGSKLGKAK